MLCTFGRNIRRSIALLFLFQSTKRHVILICPIKILLLDYWLRKYLPAFSIVKGLFTPLKTIWILWWSTSKLFTYLFTLSVQFSSVQLLSCVWLFVNPWITACQASLSIINFRSLLKLMSIKPVMRSSHLILCRPLLLLPSIPPTIRVFSGESTLRMRWPKYWSFSFSISPSNEHPGLFSFRMDWLDVLAA